MTGRTELHICQGNTTGLYYKDSVIEEPIVVSYARRHGNTFIFQGDNATAHRARPCCPKSPAASQSHDSPIQPTKSPDLSPIGKRVQRRPHKPQDINELADALQEEGCRISQATNERLIRRLRRRCVAWLAAAGGPTRYLDFCEIDIPTLTKLEVKFKSRESLNNWLLAINMLSKCRFYIVT